MTSPDTPDSAVPVPAAPQPCGPTRRLARPRTVLLACVVFALLSVSLYNLVTLLLPARLTDGPMVQYVTRDAASVVFYTSKPAAGQLAVEIAGRRQLWATANEGDRHRIRLTGLEPDCAYPYDVLVNGRSAFRATLRTAPPPAGDAAAAVDASSSEPRPSGRAVGPIQSPTPPVRPLSFVVFGDSGRASQAQYELVPHMLKCEPDLVLHTGDVVYGGGERRDYPAKFFRPYAELLPRVCFWPALGNHDAKDPTFGGDLLGVFELPENGPAGIPPERNYWFDYGDARFVVVDSNLPEEELAGRVAPWLEQVLAGPVRWRFVAMHHPPYTSGGHQPSEPVRRALVPAMERAGVDVAFFGHDHTYQRTAPLRGEQIVPAGQGVVYVVTGEGGADLYEIKPPDQRPAYLLAADDQHHSFTHVRIEGDTLTLRQIARDGSELDRWQWVKSGVSTRPASTRPASIRPASRPAFP